MNKNLKKVISAAAALTISASSFAAFAVDFPDVAADASYYQAVQELSALNIISGYEDGTFKPENLVTRAEITKMIVDALGKTKVAESAKNIATKFSDVQAGEWYTGYVATGATTGGFIAGFEDSTFKPNDNVTYVQAQKMLVAALGYEGLAQSAGGWPTGYTSYASQKGITKGVTAMADDQLTRAQVAQMIDNAMDVPVVVAESYSTDFFGNQVPNYKIKDGKGKGYETLFTRLNTYKVFGRVTATSKSSSGVDVDQVEFKVEKADNFDDEYVGKDDSRDSDPMYYGSTNAEDLLRVYSEALVQKNDDDEYTILSIVPAAANKSVSLLAEDIDANKTDLSKNVLYFYPAGQTRGSVKYEIADDAEYYVNGQSMGEFDADAYKTYIYDDENKTANDANRIVLQKETATGSTNATSKYNVIMITTYLTAVVNNVEDDTDEITISLKDISDKDYDLEMILEKDNEDKKYTFELNGEAIEATDLQEFDVLTISYEIGNFADSQFYDVVVSRDTAEGRLKSTSGNKVTVGENTYKYANGMYTELESSTDYVLHLDAFGRIAYVEEEESSKNIGILKNVYQKTNGDYVAEVITKEGKKVELSIDDKNGEEYAAIVGENGKDKTTFKDRVVEYKTSGTGKFTIKEQKGGDKTLAPTESLAGEYKSGSMKLGKLRISENTTIIDLTSDKKDDYSVVSIEKLKNGANYDAYGYEKSNTTNAYTFVIITGGMNNFDSNSQLAMFVQSGEETVDGETYDTMTFYYNGEKQDPILVDEDADVNAKAFSEGDLVVYRTNAAGKIAEVVEVFAEGGMLDNDDFGTFSTKAVETPDSILATEDWDTLLNTDGEEDSINMVFGAVVYEDGRNNTNTAIFAPIKDGKAQIADGFELSLDSTVKAYTYNYGNRYSDGARMGANASVKVTKKVQAAFDDIDNATTFDLTNEKVDGNAVFAVARVCNDDEVQEIVFIYEK